MPSPVVSPIHDSAWAYAMFQRISQPDVCCVCLLAESSADDPLVACDGDGCDVCVHRGKPELPVSTRSFGAHPRQTLIMVVVCNRSLLRPRQRLEQAQALAVRPLRPGRPRCTYRATYSAPR